MRSIILGVALSCAATPAFADATPSAAPYAPIVLSSEDVDRLQAYLDKQPYAFSAPIVQFLTEKERAARDQQKPDKKDGAKP